MPNRPFDPALDATGPPEQAPRRQTVAAMERIERNASVAPKLIAIGICALAAIGVLIWKNGARPEPDAALPAKTTTVEGAPQNR